MASIRKELIVDAPVEHVWAALRDIGNVHTRLAQQFVTETKLDGDSRLVTFANGEVVRERIVDIDDRARRLAYAVSIGGRRITTRRFRLLLTVTAEVA